MENFNHNFDIHSLDVEVGGQTLNLQTGLIARQADGAVMVTWGETKVLATAVCTKEQKPGISDFMPLTVNYKERTYAAGKIPGGFFKREGRASKKETLSSRIIDRTLRPIFPEGFACETNVTAMVLSSDDLHGSDVISVLASSAALVISSIPFNEPVAAVRIGRINGQYIVNPTKPQEAECDMDLVIAGSAQGLLMVEGGANLVRWMHITPWKQDVESCDRVGLIQAMPAGDAEKDREGRQWEQRMELMRDAIIYNRNNPSILFYECGNESISREHMLQMKAIRDLYDPHGGRAIGSREMLDIREAEYGGEMLYINKSKHHPMWAMEYCRQQGFPLGHDKQSSEECGRQCLQP